MPTATKRSNQQPTPPRSGSKLHAVLKQLKLQNGTNIDRISKITGWQPHTVRAALTGLRKRGYDIRRATKEGGKATYTILAE